MFRKHSWRFWAIVAVIAAAAVFYFPSLVAYRYTAPAQSASFLSHPWRSWEFLYTAFRVPGDARLKTSGAAFRRAEELFEGSAIGVSQARLLFLEPGARYEVPQRVGAIPLTVSIVPRYRFVWQIDGVIRELTGDVHGIVGMLDYRSGELLWDVRDHLPGAKEPGPD